MTALVTREEMERVMAERDRLRELNQEMLAALTAISSNPHCDLGSLVYKVRESEGEGWHGPAVTAWGNAVEAVKAVIAKAK